MTNEEALNTLIKTNWVDSNKISDGYHTFEELYEHRVELFIALCKMYSRWESLAAKGITYYPSVWRSELHSDESKIDGWFIMGLGFSKGKQITYHLPMSKWEDTKFAWTIEKAPEFDGHTSDDVLERLKSLK